MAESHEPGSNVRAVAARHDAYPSPLHKWRRQMRDGRVAVPPAPHFLPVHVTDAAPAAPVRPPARRPSDVETIKDELPDGYRLHAGNAVSLATLRRVVAAMRGARCPTTRSHMPIFAPRLKQGWMLIGAPTRCGRSRQGGCRSCRGTARRQRIGVASDGHADGALSAGQKALDLIPLLITESEAALWSALTKLTA